MSPAGAGAAAFKAIRERRFRTWLRNLDAQDIGNIGSMIGAACIALFVFGMPIYAILNGTNALTALFG